MHICFHKADTESLPLAAFLHTMVCWAWNPHFRILGFLFSFDRGMSYGEALNFASACGSATAASNGLANRSTIERFYAALNHLLADEKNKVGQEVVEVVETLDENDEDDQES